MGHIGDALLNVIGISGFHDSVTFKRRQFPNLSERDFRIVQGLDSAAALVTGDGVVAAAAEERFNREKGTGAFPYRAIQYCLQAGGLTASEIDFVAHGFAYEPFRPLFLNNENDFIKNQFLEVYSRAAQLRLLQEYFPSVDWSDRFIQVPHHLAHAASTFDLSGFEESLILIADGMGELDSTTIAVGCKDSIRVVKRIRALHSLGVLYGVFTAYLGFDINSDEYKVMGLAPYGNSSRYFDQIMDLVNLQKDGTYTIPILFQNENLEEKETYSGTLRLLAERFGPPRDPSSEINQSHMDMAAGIQQVLQASLLHIVRHFKKETNQQNLCMAGGVALNCTANGVIKRSRLFKNMFIQPAAGDDGSALGAAVYVQRVRQVSPSPQRMALPLWGPSYDDNAIKNALDERGECDATYFDSFDALAHQVAQRINQGQIVGWFQGRMEFGPRALGNRSILADPRDPGMRDRINALVKKREAFRPFAPAVTMEAATQFFDIDPKEESMYAHMIVVTHVRQAYREQLPAITHIDGSARVQTVAKNENPRFWILLSAFGMISGMPIALNTSFNVRGQPIVCNPSEALETFLAASLDALAIGNFLVVRKAGHSG
jgi:carbamoyltransferase